MGMQVHFSIHPDDGATITLAEGCEDWYVIDLSDGAIVAGTSSNGSDFWFDCGSCTDTQISNIRKLIRNRICFNVS